MPGDRNNISAALEASKKELLDLGLRNPLTPCWRPASGLFLLSSAQVSSAVSFSFLPFREWLQRVYALAHAHLGTAMLPENLLLRRGGLVVG